MANKFDKILGEYREKDGGSLILPVNVSLDGTTFHLADMDFSVHTPNSIDYTSDQPDGLSGLYITATNLNNGDNAYLNAIYGYAQPAVSTLADVVGFGGGVSPTGYFGLTHLKRIIGFYGANFSYYSPILTIDDSYAFFAELFKNWGGATVIRDYTIGLNGRAAVIGTGSDTGFWFTSADGVDADSRLYRREVGEVGVSGGHFTGFVSKTGNYTLTGSDNIVAANAVSGGFTLTLPTAVGFAGREYKIKKSDSTNNAVIVATTSSQTIDGQTTQTINTPYVCMTLISDGANWLII